MKHVRIYSYVLFMFIVVTFSCRPNDESAKFLSSDGTKKIYFSLVEKDQRFPYLNRIPTETGAILVTKEIVDGVASSLVVEVSVDEQLHLVQPRTSHLIVGEIGRFNGVAVINLPRGMRLPFSNEYFYLGPVAKVEKGTPWIPNVPLREIINETPQTQFSKNVDIPRAALEKKLRELSGDTVTQIDGQEVRIQERGTKNGRDLARAYLKREFEALGFATTTVPYEKEFMDEKIVGANFVAEKRGVDSSKVFVISAHFDNVQNPGADDNGSGTVSLVAIAAAIKDFNFKVNVRFVGFDQEEQGLVGSEAYVQQLIESGEIGNVVGVFNLDMTGYDKNNDGKVAIVDCNENVSAELTSLLVKSISTHQIALKKISSCTNGSDHSSFWDPERPAVLVIEEDADFNSCYHQTCDKVNIINYDFMTKIANLVAKTTVDYLAQPL